MKFVCVTQVGRQQVFNGPSGLSYFSLIGTPFKVENKEDQEHFLNQEKKFGRFKKVGPLTKAKKQPTEEELLADYLKGVKGLKEESIEGLVKTFKTKRKLEDSVLGGDKLNMLSPEEAGALTAAVKLPGGK